MTFDPLREDWLRVCDKCFEQGYETLNDCEKLWINTSMLIASINNGGLISYFYNSHAERYTDCVVALEQLQAHEVLKQLQRLAALFGEYVPTSIDRRNEIINSWSDYGPEHDLCGSTDDVLMPLMDPLEEKLLQFVASHSAELR